MLSVLGFIFKPSIISCLICVLFSAYTQTLPCRPFSSWLVWPVADTLVMAYNVWNDILKKEGFLPPKIVMNVGQFSHDPAVVRSCTHLNISLVISLYLNLAVPFQLKAEINYRQCLLWVGYCEGGWDLALRILHPLLLGKLENWKPLFLYAPVEKKV